MGLCRASPTSETSSPANCGVLAERVWSPSVHWRVGILGDRAIDLSIPGWMSTRDLRVIAAAAALVPSGGTIVEIGPFLGRCASCRSRCERPTSPGCWRAGRRASSFPISNKARSGRTCSARPASSGSRAWYRNAAIGPIAPGRRRIGQGEEPQSSGDDEGEGVVSGPEMRKNSGAVQRPRL
jgi:hypothetical protein